MTTRFPAAPVAIVYSVPLTQVEAAGFDLRPEHVARELPVRVEEVGGHLWLHALDPRLDYAEEREIANLVRHTIAGGASFAGWVARNLDGTHTDPIALKHHALRNLVALTESYLNAHLVHGPAADRLIDKYAPTAHTTGRAR